MSSTNTSEKQKLLFESLPVPRAVASLALPTIISNIVSMVYNLADVFFVGQMNDPYAVAAVALVYPWFAVLSALGNLFGVGGSCVISRYLGEGTQTSYRLVQITSSFSFYGGMAATGSFCLLSFLFRNPLLRFLGASPDTMAFAFDYLLGTVLVGGLPTMLTLTLAHLLRSEGHSMLAGSITISGGILNMFLDPLFIFVLDLGVLGAALATALSNLCSFLAFLFIFFQIRKTTHLSLSLRRFSPRIAKNVLTNGASAALGTILANAANVVTIKLLTSYNDLAIAAYGIVRKVDLVPTNICMGLCQGVTPLLAYNYAAGFHTRMKRVLHFSWRIGFAFALACTVLFFSFAPQIMHIFIADAQTVSYGAHFIRIACLSIPFIITNFFFSYTLQAMGYGRQSAFLTILRQGIFNIGLLFPMSYLFQMEGIIATKVLGESLTIPFSLFLYFRATRSNHTKSLEKSIST